MHRVRKRCKNLLLVTKTMSNPSPCLPLNMWNAAWLVGEPWGQWEPDTGLCPSCASCQLLIPCCSPGRVALTHPGWPWQWLGDAAPAITCEMVMESTVWLHLREIPWVCWEGGVTQPALGNKYHSSGLASDAALGSRWICYFCFSIRLFHLVRLIPRLELLPSWQIWVNSPLRGGKKLKGSAGNSTWSLAGSC